MDKLLKGMTKGKIYCLISAVIIFGSYTVQRIISILTEPSRTSLIAEALVFSALTAVVYFFVSKSSEPFYGILISIFGIRMLPPEISTLSEYSAAADFVYLLVAKAAFLIFLVAIIRLYQKQEGENKLDVVPIICVIIIVPISNEIQAAVTRLVAYDFKESMLYAYFAGFILYSAAMIFLLYIAGRYSSASTRLICDYQLIALLVNFARRACAVIINVSTGTHISRSYYCWLLIYVFFFIAFIIRRKKSLSVV